jgi:tetratricopeptide (TPR) repeat protein
MAERQKVVAAQAAAQRQRDEQERQQQAARQAEAAQQARDQAAQRERQMQDIRRQLGNLNAGQLFARADEYRNKGQIDEAREALRLLVSKFPNHGLAPTAAQQLASLPQEGGPMPTPQPGGQGTVGGVGGVGGAGGSNVVSAARGIDACDPNAHLRIKEMLARFTEPLLRNISNNVMPIRGDAEKSIMMVRSWGEGIPWLVRELQKVINEHRQQKKPGGRKLLQDGGWLQLERPDADQRALARRDPQQRAHHGWRLSKRGDARGVGGRTCG